MKNPRFSDENTHPLKRPDENKIPCKDCVYRLADRQITDDFSIKGATLAGCKMYFEKPHEILWEGHDCPHHVRNS